MASNYIEQALYTDLKTSTAVHDHIADRVFFALADQEATQPYCVFQTISDPHTPLSFDASDTGQARVQFTIVDNDRYDALDAAHAVRDRLDKYSVAMDSMTIYTLNCTGVMERAEDDNTFLAHFDAIIQYKDV